MIGVQPSLVARSGSAWCHTISPRKARKKPNGGAAVVPRLAAQLAATSMNEAGLGRINAGPPMLSVARFAGWPFFVQVERQKDCVDDCTCNRREPYENLKHDLAYDPRAEKWSDAAAVKAQPSWPEGADRKVQIGP